MFNSFTIQNADSQKIADTYSNLQKELSENADTGFLISKNIEIYANMNYLIGEMIARIQHIESRNFYCGKQRSIYAKETMVGNAKGKTTSNELFWNYGKRICKRR